MNKYICKNCETEFNDVKIIIEKGCNSVKVCSFCYSKDVRIKNPIILESYSTRKSFFNILNIFKFEFFGIFLFFLLGIIIIFNLSKNTYFIYFVLIFILILTLSCFLIPN